MPYPYPQPGSGGFAIPAATSEPPVSHAVLNYLVEEVEKLKEENEMLRRIVQAEIGLARGDAAGPDQLLEEIRELKAALGVDMEEAA